MLADSHLEHIIIERQETYDFLQTILKTDHISQKAIQKAQLTKDSASWKRSDLGQNGKETGSFKIFPHSKGCRGVCNGTALSADSEGFVIFTATW